MLLSAKGDVEGAMRDFDRAIRINPKSAQPFYNRATLLAKAGKKKRALNDFTKAIDRNEKFVNAWLDRSNVHFSNGDIDKALFGYEKVIELDPNNAVAYNNRGYMMQLKGKMDVALEYYGKAIAKAPKFAWLISTAHRRMMRSANINCRSTTTISRCVSIRSTKKTLKLSAKHASAYNLRGNDLFAKKKYVEAIADYDRAHALNPRASFILYNRGNAKKKLGQFKQAVADYNDGDRA